MLRATFQTTTTAKEEGWDAWAVLTTKLSRWVLSAQL